MSGKALFLAVVESKKWTFFLHQFILLCPKTKRGEKKKEMINAFSVLKCRQDYK
jgi:hypothetical protein